MLMKHVNYRKSRLLLTAFLAFVLSLGGTARAWAEAKTLPYSYGFEDYNLATDGWTTQNPSGKNNSEFAIVGAAKKTGSYGFRFSSYTDHGANTQYLISPELNTPTGVVVSFEYAASSASSSGETFKVGYSTTDTAIESFTWGEEISYKSTSWQTFNNSFPAGTKYVAIYYYAEYQYRLYVDDFSFKADITGPALGVKGYYTGETIAFGLANGGANRVITLTNPGTESVTASIVTTGGFTTESSKTIAAKGEETLTITLPAEGTGEKAGTIQLSAAGVETITLNLSCTLADPDKSFVDFNDNALPAGWETVGVGSYTTSSTSSYKWDFSQGYAAYQPSYSSEAWMTNYYHSLVSPLLTFGVNEKISFKIKKYVQHVSYYGSLYVEYSTDKSEWTTASDGHFAPADIPDNWIDCEVTIPSTAKYIRFRACGVAIDDIYGGQESDEPIFSFTPADYDFGFIITDTQKTFTINNIGKTELTGLTAEVTGNFEVAVANSIAGKSSTDLTVTMKADQAGQQNGVVTIKVNGEEKATFNVSGYVADNTKFFENFNATTCPDGWQVSGNNAKWTFPGGAASSAWGTPNGYLITPSLTVAGTEDVLTFFAKTTKNSVTITVEKSVNGTDWTSCASFPVDNADQGKTIMYTIKDIEAGNYQLRFKNDDYDLLLVNGFTQNAEAPVMGIFTDEACQTAAMMTVTKDYEFIGEAQTLTYYIKNTGTGTLTLNDPIAEEPLTATLTAKELTEGQVATLTINVPVATIDAKKLTVAAKDNLGTFTATISAIAKDPAKFDIDFSTASLPEDWTNESDNDYMMWKKDYTKGCISAGGTSGLVSTPFTAVANDDVIVKVSGNALTVQYKAVGAEEWTQLGNSEWKSNPYLLKMKMPETLETGKYLLRFSGSGAEIYRIYGLAVPQEPKLVITPADSEKDFGMQTDAADYEVTVKNDGTGSLEGVKAELSGDDAAAFEVAISIPAGSTATIAEGVATIPAGQTVTVKATLKQSTEYKKVAAVLTISTTTEGISAKQITLKGQTRDAAKELVTFDDGQWPEGWKHEGWTITDKAARRSLTDAATLTTSPIKADKLYFDAKRAYAADAAVLSVRYSVDGGTTWSAAQSYEGISSEQATLTLEGLDATKTMIVEFTGASVVLDNIYGFVNVQAPALTLTENGVAVNTAETVDFGSDLKADTEAKVYTITNTGNADLVSTFAAEGISAVITKGDAPVEGQLTLAAGETATISVLMAYEAPYGDKTGKLTITSEGGIGTVVLNFKANFAAPDALVIDFDDNQKPAGWYNGPEGYNWSFTNGTANIYSGIEKELITEKFGVADAANVMTFEAWANAASVLKVYTSADRKTWSEAQTFELTTEHKTFSTTAFTADSYVKFESANATIDNIKGLKKLAAPAHDLYFVSATIPATVTEKTDFFTAGITVANLAGAESDVKVELLFDGVSKGSVDDASIAADAIKLLECGVAMPYNGTYKVKVKVTTADEVFSVESAEADVTINIEGNVPTVDGIGAIILKSAQDGKVYNLNGQRVENPKKGQLYIVNGKTVIVK